MQSKLKEAEKMINEYKLKIEELNSKLELSKKINLNIQFQNNKDNDSFNQTFYKRDQMIALNFISSDQKLHFAIPCVTKDLFVDVEKKLYEQFPEYKETNNNFLVDAKMILRFKSIEENKLKSGIPIMIIPIRNS